MPTIPTEQELYDEMKAAVSGDPDTNLTDYSPGSVLDVMSGTVATAARSIMRWILRSTRVAFVSTAEGDDLEYVILDRIDLAKDAGESDEEYRARYYGYIEALGRGTEVAWRYFIENIVEGVDSLTYELEEDLDTGIVTITIAPLDGYTESGIKAEADNEKVDWRVYGGPAVNVETKA